MLLKSLDIHLTNACNLDCRHCVYDSRYDNKDENELTLADFKKIFLDFLKISSSKGTINFLGGEPTVRRDFFEVAYLAKKLGLKTTLVSNFHFSNSLSKRILDFGLTKVCFGLHGCKQNHDWLRNLKGDFQNSIELIKKFLTLKSRPHINITTVLHKNNLSDVIPLLKLANDLKIDSYSFFFFTPIGRGANMPDLTIDPINWIRTRNKIIKWAKHDKPCFSIRWEGAFIFSKNYTEFTGGFCAGKRITSLEIRSNGIVYPCGLMSGVKGPNFGNLKKDNLSNIYKNISSLRISDVPGCTALALQNQKKTGILKDPRPIYKNWFPTCPYEIEQLFPRVLKYEED